jgi:hypothetical protein
MPLALRPSPSSIEGQAGVDVTISILPSMTRAVS